MLFSLFLYKININFLFDNYNYMVYTLENILVYSISNFFNMDLKKIILYLLHFL